MKKKFIKLLFWLFNIKVFKHPKGQQVVFKITPMEEAFLAKAELDKMREYIHNALPKDKVFLCGFPSDDFVKQKQIYQYSDIWGILEKHVKEISQL